MSPSAPRALRRGRRPARPPFRPRLEVLEGRLAPAAFTVSNTNDGGAGSLRQAILDANANPGLDTVQFAIPGAGTHTIAPLSPLPFVTDPVLLDGATQPGFAGTPLVQLSGALAGVGANGLVVTAGGTLVRGLAVGGFGGIAIYLAQNGGDVVTADYVGTNAAGSAAAANAFGVVVAGGGSDQVVGDLLSGNTYYGLTLNNTSADLVSGDLIGVNAAGSAALANGAVGVTLNGNSSGNVLSGNVIGGNAAFGVLLYGPGVSGNLLAGNYVGLNPAAAALPNGLAGVALAAGAAGNSVGGPTPAYRNVISDNAADGVFLEGAGTNNNVVESDYIGTNPAGTASAPNAEVDVLIQDGAANNLVGTDLIAGANISTVVYGVEVEGAGTTGNVVASCLIGSNAAGTAALPYLFRGVQVLGGASGNLISGDLVVACITGVEITGAGTTANVVQSCFFGTNLAGTAFLGDADGVDLVSASGNTVGGATAAQGNVIAASFFCVRLDALSPQSGPSSGNAVLNNRVGTNAAGTAAFLPGSMDGIYLGRANDNAVVGNVVAGGTEAGVLLAGSGSVLQGNRIGTNAAGTAALPNAVGVLVRTGSGGNTVGGTAAGAGNVISGNTGAGIDVQNGSGTVIEGNLIGTAADGLAPLGNGAQGVIIEYSQSLNNTVGGSAAGAGNVIAFNGDDGVLVGSVSGATGNFLAGVGNSVLGNSIYGNGKIGIDLGPDDGVTANGAAGATGPNNYQPFPVLTAATATGGAAIISGTLGGRGDVPYRLEFFASPSPDPSGHGQGKRFLGFATFVPYGLSPTSYTFVAVLSAALAPGEVVSATATDPAGNTSEFSADVTAH
jgi:titin